MLGKNDDGQRFLTKDTGELGSLHILPAAHRPTCLVTKEHRRFAEFADTVRAHRYIGVCWGPAGIGKTRSARQYTGADEWAEFQKALITGSDHGPVPDRILQARAAFYTPTVAATMRQLDQDLPRLSQQISYAIDYAEHRLVDPFINAKSYNSRRTELLIIDEADRLKTPGLEQVRDYYDRHDLGLVLIGMPGIEKRLARYPQLYSRIGFAHEYRPLTPDELTAVLTRRWHDDGLTRDDEDDFTRSVAIATVTRITGGNFRLVDRLLTQIRRIRDINHLDTITTEIVEAAREALLIGT